MVLHIILWDGDKDKPIRYYDTDVWNLGNLIRNCNILHYKLDAEDISRVAGRVKIIRHEVVQA